MNNLVRNAIKIAELIGLPTTPPNTFVFEYYDGLLPIVFECNSSHFSIIQVARLYHRNYILFVDVNDCTSNDPVYYETEPEFIEALQLAVIKYLKLKNEK